MQEVVIKLDIHDDDKCKRKAMKLASTVHGIDSISMNIKDQKMTFKGSMDPIELVQKMRKVFHAEVLSIGPVKEPEKKKEEPKVEAQVYDYKPFEFLNYYNYPTYPRYPTFY